MLAGKTNGFRILLYHSVGKIDPLDNLGIRISQETFASQMEYLSKAGFRVLSLKDAYFKLRNNWAFPKHSVVITFDDGYKDNILEAIPILEKFMFKAAFFITHELIGKTKTSPRRSWQNWDCLDWADIKKIESMGHTIGSHSLFHVNLNELPLDEKNRQVRLSKEKFDAELKQNIEFFSYPYGYFDNKLINVLRSAGYKAACTSLMGANRKGINPYMLRRTEVARFHIMDDFKKRLEGRDDWMRFFKKEFYLC